MIRDRAVLYLGIAQTLVWAGMFYVFPALLLRWEAALGWSRAELTGAITVALLLSALASPLAGRLIDAGRGPVMLAGATLLGGLCLIGLSVVTEAWQFYLVWALLGVMMGGSLYDPCFALLTRARGAEAKRSIIQITLMAGFASTISFPAAHALADAYDWRVAVRIFAVVVILVGGWACTRVERESAQGTEPPAFSVRGRLDDPLVITWRLELEPCPVDPDEFRDAVMRAHAAWTATGVVTSTDIAKLVGRLSGATSKIYVGVVCAHSDQQGPAPRRKLRMGGQACSKIFVSAQRVTASGSRTPMPALVLHSSRSRTG